MLEKLVRKRSDCFLAHWLDWKFKSIIQGRHNLVNAQPSWATYAESCWQSVYGGDDGYGGEVWKTDLANTKAWSVSLSNHSPSGRIKIVESEQIIAQEQWINYCCIHLQWLINGTAWNVNIRFKGNWYKNKRTNKVGCTFAKSMSAVGPTRINNSIIANFVHQMWLVLVRCRLCWCWNFIAPRNTYIYYSAAKCLFFSSLVRLYSSWRTQKKIDASWNEESRYRPSESSISAHMHTVTPTERQT